MADNLADQLAIEQIDTDHFISQELPLRSGNTANIGYGGCITGVAVHAACKTVGPRFHVYSVLGAFLGPTSTKKRVQCRVTRLRDTKSFATRQVLAFQVQDDGLERKCAHMAVDFHVEETALLRYSIPPRSSLGSDPEDEKYALPSRVVLQRAVDNSLITSEARDAFMKFFTFTHEFFDINQCLYGVSAQNALGIAKHAKTTQDELPIYNRRTADWLRSKQSFDSYAENAAALSFMLDGSLSFLPLLVNHMGFDDAGACSTLDFALRIMTPRIDVGAWNLREQKTIGAGGGRTYSEQKLWSRDGQLTAVMTQTGILRPPRSKEQMNAARI